MLVKIKKDDEEEELSPFAKSWEAYSGNGLSVIPIHPHGKNPAFIDRYSGAWVGITDWTRFCTEHPSEELLQYWATMPYANIGVPLGPASNLACVDIDAENLELQKKFLKALPFTPFVKIGKKGMTLFYQYTSEVPTKSFALDGERTKAIEFFTLGKQTVLPPSIHPDTKREYRWQDPQFSFAFHSPKAAPILTVEAFAACAKIVGMKLRHIEKMIEKRQLPDAPVEFHADNVWNELCARALNNLDAWVPQLFPDHKQLNRYNYRINAIWRGGENYNLSIHPEGIYDWVDGQGYTPIQLLQKAFNSSPMEAYCVLSDLIIPESEKKAEKKLAEAMIETHRATSIVPDILPSKTHASVALSTPIIITKIASRLGQEPEPLDPEIYTSAPNLLGRIASYIRGSSGSPLPELALASALPLLSTVIGNRIATETNLRGNVYCLGLAASGTGKNDTIKIPVDIMTRLGSSANLIGTPSSSSGLLHAMNRGRGTSLWLQDEFGRFLRFINHPNSSNHEATVLNALMELYTSSESAVYHGREYAPSSVNSKAQKVLEPYLNFYGVSVAEHVFDNLTSKDAVDGFAARWLVFYSNATAAAPMFRRASSTITTPDTATIIDDILAIRADINERHYALNKSGNPFQDATAAAQIPITVTYTEDAFKYLSEVVVPLIQKKKQVLDETGFAYLTPVWNRSAAHIGKVALLASDFHQIDSSVAVWASEVVLHLMDYTTHKLATSVVDTLERQAARDIYQAIQELNIRLNRWVLRSELLRHRNFKKYDKKMIQAGIELLLEMNVVECQLEKSGKRPSMQFKVCSEYF